MYERILFEAEGDLEVFLVEAGEIDADGGNGDWSLRLGQAELDHEPLCWQAYLTSLGFVSISDMWYWYFFVHVYTIPSTSRYATDASDIIT